MELSSAGAVITPASRAVDWDPDLHLHLQRPSPEGLTPLPAPQSPGGS